MLYKVMSHGFVEIHSFYEGYFRDSFKIEAMKITDFEKNITQKILDKGHQYFLEQRVVDLEKIAPGMWMAQVHGSDTYLVEVDMKRNSIVEWDCDCLYEHGPICKHVVAMFYAIQGEMDKNKSKPGSKKTGTKKKSIISHVERSVSKYS